MLWSPRPGDNTGPMRVVALLRGVNLGPSRRLRMADLREVVTAHGHGDVATYLQSGNVVFTPAAGRSDRAEDLAAGLSAAIAEQLGLRTDVVVRTGAEMAAVVAATPYDRDDPTKLAVTFLDRPADPAAFAALDLASFAPEGLTVHGRELYLDLPFGQGRSKLMEALGRGPMAAAAGTATTRNWRTVLALAEMTA
jgi:uncharacterized protein (DUF1697 family)